MAPTTFEAQVIQEWRALPYHGFGLCANADCQRPAHCCGRNPRARVCLDCFEFVYGCKAPTKLRLH